jgi:hypothetical protein
MRSALWAGFCALALSAIVTGAAEAKPRPGNPNKGFRLFARPLGALVINRIYCGLSSSGEICVDSTNSSTIGGGFWPKGTADQYVFNSGIQVAGLIGPDANPEWAGDTTGAQFFSPRGDNVGEEFRPIFNASNPDDVANWPEAAKVPAGDASEELFNPLLRGRVSASQGDVWFLSWEGNPAFSAGREHPLGILIEQRGMGYNFPAGNEDILYFIYTFYNVTASDPTAYAAVRPGMREVLVEAGTRFQSLNENRFNISIPNGGYTITNLFAAFGADMDVAESGANYASVNVPFSLGYTYESSFAPAAGWTFDPSIFSPPFFPGPGFVGVKYLKSPTIPGTTPPQEVGLTLFSNTINQGAFDDPQNVIQLFRYLSNNISPAAGDAACNTGNPQATKICYVNNGQEADMRFFQASGPLELGPGAFGSIVVAYIFAAPTITGSCVGPGTCTLTPGDPTRLSDPVRLQNEGANAVDSVAGFRGLRGTYAAGDTVFQDSVNVVPGSLLGKSLVAQEVFRNRFLLPFAPDAPNFFLLPGDNLVTVLWQPTASETTGDPFFAVSSQPLTPEGAINTLFDPNYRQNDVEGYRVYRGRVDSPQSLQLLAQFDYAGTTIRDFGGQINPTDECAPELTPQILGTCLAAFEVRTPGVAPTVGVDVALAGPIVQVAVPNRAALATGKAILLRADTAITGAAGGCLTFGNAAECDLRDTGVPFVYVDHTARNNLRYFYSVTAFDINSLQSGPSSIESPRVTKSVLPNASAANVSFAPPASFTRLGDDDQPLPAGTTPFTINASTGRFPGTPPHNLQITGSIETSVLALATALGGTGITATIDSAKARFNAEAYPLDNIPSFACLGLENAQGLCHEYFVTYVGPTGSVQTRTVVKVPILSTFDAQISIPTRINPAPVPLDPTVAAQFGLPAGLNPPAAGFTVTVPRHGENSAGENFFGRRTGGAIAGATDPLLNYSPGGSRWFDTPNETLDDPGYGIRVGHLTGVDSIFAPLSHIDQTAATPGVQAPPASVCMQMFNYITSTFGRQADIEVVWGAGGALASVRDLSTNINIPFKATPQSSYGFVNDYNGNGRVDWLDITQVEEIAQGHVHSGFCTDAANVAIPVALPAAGAGAALTQTAVAQPVSVMAAGTVPANHLATGVGFGLYVAGHFHIFQLTGGVLPAAGTRWVLRSVSGAIRAATGADGLNPEGYTFTQRPGNPAVAGLRFRYVSSAATAVRETSDGDLEQVHTVPDPYYVTNAFEQTTDAKVLKFVNLPTRAIIRIYSSSGVLVSLIEHNSPTFGGSEDWNVRNRNNQVVASGVYFYHIEAGGARRVGRFTIVNFAQ